jgi:hypothetical protein
MRMSEKRVVRVVNANDDRPAVVVPSHVHALTDASLGTYRQRTNIVFTGGWYIAVNEPLDKVAALLWPSASAPAPDQSEAKT